jgi:hypothetical protein
MSQTAGVLDGYVDVEPFAKEVERSPRTILRWMDQPNGFPTPALAIAASFTSRPPKRGSLDGCVIRTRCDRHDGGD